jgi:L-asparaginase/Glu-tRNA(Gln) amidotransferase subunit D
MAAFHSSSKRQIGDPPEDTSLRKKQRSYRPEDLVVILDCGGTISCGRNEVGQLAPRHGIIEEWLANNDNIRDLVDNCTICVESVITKDSSHFSPEDWDIIIGAVTRTLAKPEVIGIVITHGTDTLCYTAAALVFAIPFLYKPVILTGAQFPLSFPISDARNNLLGALVSVIHSRVPEVLVFFNFKLLLGHRIQKISASDVDCFSTPNARHLGVYRDHLEVDRYLRYKIIRHRILCLSDAGILQTIKEFAGNRATLSYQLHSNEAFLEEAIKLLATRPFGALFENPYFSMVGHVAKLTPIKRRFVEPIQVIELYPGLSQLALPESDRGYVIRAFGAGNGPKGVEEWLDVCEANNVLVAVCTSCITGGVTPAYEAGLKVHSNGTFRKNVALVGDLTIEACVAKMTYLPTDVNTLEEMVSYMECSIRGELSK